MRNSVKMLLSSLLGGGRLAATYHIAMNGSSDYLLVAADAALADLHTGNFTVEMSLYEDAASTGTMFVDKAGDQQQGWLIAAAASQKLQFIAVGDSNTTNIVTSTDRPLGSAYHLAVVHDFTNSQVRIYINGTEASYQASNAIVTLLPATDASLPLSAFAHYDGSPSGYVKGNLYWLRISNSVKYTANFSRPSLTYIGNPQADTILQLSLDEGTGTPVDSSASGVTVSVSNGDWEAD